MSNTLSDTMNAAKNGIESAKDGATHALESVKDGAKSAKEGTLQTVADVVSMVLKGVSATGAIIAMLQRLDRDDGLAWIGLSRRRSPLLTVALLGAGAAAGAGVALWFAPMAGADLRNFLTGRAKRAVGATDLKVEAAAAR